MQYIQKEISFSSATQSKTTHKLQIQKPTN